MVEKPKDPRQVTRKLMSLQFLHETIQKNNSSLYLLNAGKFINNFVNKMFGQN
jgi:hypothetical protein